MKGVTGYILPGQTHYIMGASGAGKTTLLNALSDRLKIDKDSILEGTRELNDSIPLNQSNFGKYCAYVMQEDILFEYLTVKEALTFAVNLKVKASQSVKEQRVMDVIQELGLEKCMNT